MSGDADYMQFSTHINSFFSNTVRKNKILLTHCEMIHSTSSTPSSPVTPVRTLSSFNATSGDSHSEPSSASSSSSSSSSSASSSPNTSSPVKYGSPVKKKMNSFLNTLPLEDDSISCLLQTLLYSAYDNNNNSININTRLKATLGSIMTTKAAWENTNACVSSTSPSAVYTRLSKRRCLFPALETDSSIVQQQAVGLGTLYDASVPQFSSSSSSSSSSASMASSAAWTEATKLKLPGVRTIIPLNEADTSLPQHSFVSGLDQKHFDYLRAELSNDKMPYQFNQFRQRWYKVTSSAATTNNNNDTNNDNNKEDILICVSREYNNEEKGIKGTESTQECILSKTNFYNPHVGESDFEVQTYVKVDMSQTIHLNQACVRLTDKNIHAYSFEEFVVYVTEVVDYNIFNGDVHPINPVNKVTYDISMEFKDASILTKEIELYTQNKPNELHALLTLFVDNMKIITKHLAGLLHPRKDMHAAADAADVPTSTQESSLDAAIIAEVVHKKRKSLEE